MTHAAKDVLHGYLRSVRGAVLGKLDGVSEYDARRPLTSTGTNLLGLVKHLAGVEFGYFGATFGRPAADAPAWLEDETFDADPNADLWARADEPRAEIVALYHRATDYADATIAALPLEAPGYVPHWPPERAEVTLQQILVHVLTDTTRHAGQADILRESIDGTVGLRRPGDNIPDVDWAAHVARVEEAARTFRS